mmetsp:Transcript_13129/g.37777  ORF Transcript_13129/g.37777 Transcript_13129/m.37777 type:complete len:275 (-) Transcript_13129:938-1762(-)
MFSTIIGSMLSDVMPFGCSVFSSLSFFSTSGFSESSLLSPWSAFFSSCFSSSSTFRGFSPPFRRASSRRSFCLRRHSCKVLSQSLSWSRNLEPGCKSSTRCVSLRSAIHFFKYAAASLAGCHKKRTSSKPSSSVGMEKLEKKRPRSFLLKSSVGNFGNHCCFSCSVNSIASSAFASSTSTTAFSAPSSFLTSSESLFSSLASPSANLRAFFRCPSARESFLFSAKMWSRVRALKSSGGSPISTNATLLKSWSAKRSNAFFRSSASKLFLTSMTM